MSAFCRGPNILKSSQNTNKPVNNFTEHDSLCLISPWAGWEVFTGLFQNNSMERGNSNIFTNECNYHIEAETKWLSFYNWLFQLFHFNLNFTVHLKYVTKLPIDFKSELVMSNGLASNRQQAIIWTNGGLVHWSIYASLSQIEFFIERTACISVFMA